MNVWDVGQLLEPSGSFFNSKDLEAKIDGSKEFGIHQNLELEVKFGRSKDVVAFDDFVPSWNGNCFKSMVCRLVIGMSS